MTGLLDKLLIGSSAATQKMKKNIERFSQFSAPVLITGETGTGKELVARGLHYCGTRADNPFISLNCSTFSDELFASEVFGHKKGAFTGAVQDKNGLIADCDNGTLFLDEVDCLSLKSQAALLRLLQEGEYRAVGSSHIRKSKARIVAATNAALGQKISAKQFREDLFYRLNILTVALKPLRERVEDIPSLISHFLTKLDRQYSLGEKSLASEFTYQWLDYKWPGNVRELENTLHREYLSSDNLLVGRNPLYNKEQELNSQISSQQIEEWNFNKAKQLAVEQFESEFVKKILFKSKGSITEGARLCGKERSALGKLVKKYNIQRFNPGLLAENIDV